MDKHPPSIHVIRSRWPTRPFTYLNRLLRGRWTLVHFIIDETKSSRPAIWVDPRPAQPKTHIKGIPPPDADPDLLRERGTIPISQLGDFIGTFRAFEGFAALGVCICLQAMLYDVAIMPWKVFWASVKLIWTVASRGLWEKPDVWVRVGWRGRSLIRGVSERFAAVVRRLPWARRVAEQLPDANMSPNLRESLRQRKASKDAASPIGCHSKLQSIGSDTAPHFYGSPVSRREVLSASRGDFSLPTPKMKREDLLLEIKAELNSEDGEGSLRPDPPLISVECRPPTILSSQDGICLVNFLVIVCVVTMFRSFLNVATMYHFIRSQSLLKLYVVYNMLEIIDRMWRSLERDLLDDLRLQADQIFSSGRGSPNGDCTVTVDSSCTDEDIARPPRKWTEIWNDRYVRFLRRFLMAAGCVAVHTGLHLGRGLLLCIAMNAPESAMFLLLISNNFAEIKGTVFKKQTPMSLWQLAASDVIERFQILTDTLFVYIQVSPRGNSQAINHSLRLLVQMVCIEIFVDFSKHAFLVKFNKMPSYIFHRFRTVCIMDVLLARCPTAVLSLAPEVRQKPIPTHYQGMMSFGHIAARRLGLDTLPFLSFLAAFAPSVAFEASFWRMVVFGSFWLAVYVALMLLTTVIVSYCTAQRSNVRDVDDSLAGLQSL